MSVAALVLAATLLGAAQFSVRPARRYRTWWVALIGTELGHVWAPLAAALAAWAAWRCTRSATFTDAGAAGLASAAALLFARPAWAAARVARRFDRELAALGAARPASGEKLFSWRRLWRAPFATRRVVVETRETDGLPLDFYRPVTRADAARAAPCVVMVHGGGWDSGDRTQLAAFNHWLAARGVAVAAVGYRLAPAHPWPAPRDDLRAAIAWLRAHATELGIDPERLTLVGRSAGGQIATATAYAEPPLPGVRAVVALYAVHDLEFVWSLRSAKDALNSEKLMQQFLGGGPDERPDLYLSASAERLAHGDAPPTVLVHGALDELVWCRHSERLAAALARERVPHAFARLPWATHAGDANLHGPSGQLITGAVLRVALAGTLAPGGKRERLTREADGLRVT